jgi:hypothetical protein
LRRWRRVVGKVFGDIPDVPVDLLEQSPGFGDVLSGPRELRRCHGDSFLTARASPTALSEQQDSKTQEMLDFCGEHGIVADVEVIPIEKTGEAFDRTIESDVRYRFVIDIASLKS